MINNINSFLKIYKEVHKMIRTYNPNCTNLHDLDKEIQERITKGNNIEANKIQDDPLNVLKAQPKPNLPILTPEVREKLFRIHNN